MFRHHAQDCIFNVNWLYVSLINENNSLLLCLLQEIERASRNVI